MGGFEEEGEGQKGLWIHWRGGNLKFGLQGWVLPYRLFLLGAVGATLSWHFPWK